MDVEISAVDRIHALLDVFFIQPSFYFGLGLLMLILILIVSIKQDARSRHSIVGRVGQVVQIIGIFMAGALLAVAAFALVQGNSANDDAIRTAGRLALIAAVIWLTGNFIRFILTGTASADSLEFRPTSQEFRSPNSQSGPSVPKSGVSSRPRENSSAPPPAA
jgi:hypothetical protein